MAEAVAAKKAALREAEIIEALCGNFPMQAGLHAVATMPVDNVVSFAEEKRKRGK